MRIRAGHSLADNFTALDKDKDPIQTFCRDANALAAFNPMSGQNVERTRNDPAPLLMEAGRSPAEVRQYQLGLSWLQVMTGARHYIP